LVAAGLVISARRAELALLFVVVFTLVYLPVIQLEEQHLAKLFPVYTEYAASVPMLWPRWHSGIATQKPAFSWRLYWSNREYQAALGYTLGVLFLLWRALR
ncbi:MAG: isoprenylcysteine carboxylmethyltransferase family protein, partial [Acidobacteriia bacterium]|nr:isoprenylcysteine carboxylmethyltransferase family protein [Terriglobia bacterium]